MGKKKSLAKTLKGKGARKPGYKPGPIWKGPEEDGITFSLLSRFLCCRERFRLLVVEGLKPADTFNHRIEYGQMWHVCEEALAGYGKPPFHGAPKLKPRAAGPPWEKPLNQYCQGLCHKYPTQQEQIQHWYNVCKVQFPLYVEYWGERDSARGRRTLLQEQGFSVPYRLPSGRAVRLRGKWDGVELVDGGLYLRENKTKGEINEEQLKTQLHFDLQTSMYLVALQQIDGSSEEELAGLIERTDGNILKPVRGVNYNVVRRPLSGGKGSIRRYKATKNKPEESPTHFYHRLGRVILEDPGYFFMRWRSEFTAGDIRTFRRQCLDPLLESLHDWWAWIVENPHDPWEPVGEAANHLHWRHPYGVYNVLVEGGSSELDSYLETGSMLGLQRVNNLFGELD